MRRVVVTGWGAVSALGSTAPQTFAALLDGCSGLQMLDATDSALPPTVVGSVALDPATVLPRLVTEVSDRASQLALLAVGQAVGACGIEVDTLANERTGIAVGIGMGGATALEDGYVRLLGGKRLKPFTVLTVMANGAAAQIGRQYAVTGPSLTYSCACASSSVAIGEAFEMIRAGRVDVMLAGGAEAPLTRGNISAWHALRALADPDPAGPQRSCKPFAADRTGLVLAEGAAFVVLEDESHARARGAPILAVMSGYGSVNDCAHLTQPSVAGQARAMTHALRRAQLAADQIDYINAHGTGTALNDKTETAAIKSVFGPAAGRVAISSTKSAHGHLLGGAGALEFVVALQAMRSGSLPPTLNLDHPDAECDLDYVPNRARHGQRIRHVMSNSFAFGGTSAVLIASAAS